MVPQLGAKAFVDFDDPGLELRPQAQARAAVAEVVERHRYAVLAQAAHGVGQGHEVLDEFVLGQLDHQAHRAGRIARRGE
jgi:hypothetical protein